jgi:hypothetical protein
MTFANGLNELAAALIAVALIGGGFFGFALGFMFCASLSRRI